LFVYAFRLIDLTEFAALFRDPDSEDHLRPYDKEEHSAAAGGGSSAAAAGDSKSGAFRSRCLPPDRPC
jgi:hypothetical protein